jgi:alkylation response protein AidB-like acyl-CoA dehydrogenase
MKLDLTEEQQLLQGTFAELFAAESSPERVRAAEATGFDAGLWKHLVETGAVAIRVPDALGGSGSSLHDAALLTEQAGRHLASAPLCESIAAASLLAQIDSEAARALLAELVAGRRVVALALREVESASTQVVPGGAAADVVLALDRDALVALRRAPGGILRPPRNIGASALASWRLDVAPPGGERSPIARGPAAMHAYQSAREEWRLLTASALVGLAQRALEIGAAYATTRIQFDRPIGSFQGLAHPFADSATEVSASQLLVSYAIWSIATAQPEAAARISFAFAAAAASAAKASARALHAHGGYGLSLEYDIQLFYRRAKAWALAGGDPNDELLRAAERLWCGASGVRLPDAGAIAIDWGLGPEAAEMGAEARAFFERELTPELRAKAHFSWDGHDVGFQKKLAQAGLLFPNWPVAYGGRGTRGYAMTALWDEYHRVGWGTHAVITTGMVGETLMKFASEELKREVLPRVLAGEAVFALGYTEPSSGSDIAAAQTRAVRDGDHWVIDGQKMFTSGANVCQYVFLITRTDTSAAKHKGLTMFLVPLDSPGIEIHPVHTISDERTNVTYYSQVRVHDRYRVGEVNGGWNVLGYALEIEHGSGGGSGGYSGHLEDLIARTVAWVRTAQRNGRPALEDARVCERLARVAMYAEMAWTLSRRTLWLGVEGRPDRGEGPMSKLFGTEMLMTAANDLLDLLAPDSLFTKGSDGAIADGEPEFAYRLAAAMTTYAGSSEIMRSIIAQQALGMPRSRS